MFIENATLHAVRAPILGYLNRRTHPILCT